MKHIHNRTKYFIDGVPAIDVARQNGISKGCVYDRLKAGWKLRKACTYKSMSTKELSSKLGLTVNKINYLLYTKTYTRAQLEDMANDNKR